MVIFSPVAFGRLAQAVLDQPASQEAHQAGFEEPWRQQLQMALFSFFFFNHHDHWLTKRLCWVSSHQTSGVGEELRWGGELVFSQVPVHPLQPSHEGDSLAVSM